MYLKVKRGPIQHATEVGQRLKAVGYEFSNDNLITAFRLNFFFILLWDIPQ